MKSVLAHEPLRLAAALLARASAGSTLTALVLLVLVGAAGAAALPEHAAQRRATAVTESDGPAPATQPARTTHLRLWRRARAVRRHPPRLPVRTHRCADQWTLPPTRAP